MICMESVVVNILLISSPQSLFIKLGSRRLCGELMITQKINRVLGHLQAKLGQDAEMNQISLPSRHKIRNSSPGGLVGLPLGQGVH